MFSARSVKPVATARRTSVTASFPSMDGLGFGRLVRSWPTHPDGTDPRSRHTGETGLLVAGPADAQRKLPIGIVECMAAIHDRRAHLVTGRAEQKLVDGEVNEPIPGIESPRAESAGIGARDVGA